MSDAVQQPFVPVILAGGSGTRLWPLSRKSYPKQFLTLQGDQTLYQDALTRSIAVPGAEAPVVIGHEDYRFLMAEQGRQCGVVPQGILLEPVARNTAAAVAVTALWVVENWGPTALIHVLTADHIIEANADYHSAVQGAAEAAKNGYIATFGIHPTNPATGYGYIEAGPEIGSGTHLVKRFVEKPDAESAQAMLDQGGFSWNSGMFLFAAETMLQAFELHQPGILNAARETLARSAEDLDFLRLQPEAFFQAEAISIDYAIAEKFDKMAVAPSHFPWSDVGSWDAVWDTNTKDDHGNAARGPATFVGAQDALVVSEGTHVVVNGLKDVAVVATDDAILVSDLKDAQSVRSVVAALGDNVDTADLLENHTTNYRPWGGYTSIEIGERYQVKRLFVDPGKKLSLQKHHHRAEHWIVVAGTAEVTIDDTVTTLFENQSIYIPQGAVHRLTNPGKIRLEVIEVQSGSYLGEDDIIRVQDDFGRS